MRTLFRHFVRWITQAQRFERLEDQLLELRKSNEQILLLLTPFDEPLEIGPSYDYGDLGELYQIKANHELVTKREN